MTRPSKGGSYVRESNGKLTRKEFTEAAITRGGPDSRSGARSGAAGKKGGTKKASDAAGADVKPGKEET